MLGSVEKIRSFDNASKNKMTIYSSLYNFFQTGLSRFSTNTLDQIWHLVFTDAWEEGSWLTDKNGSEANAVFV